ncbi:MAG TPA: multiheme c-type cytochrome, partial [Terriglobales bacterium]|nr:multiheme c-type cytochrome [Terriglobales bacterium]
MIFKIKQLLGRRLLAPMLVFLFASAVYLYAFPQPNFLYAVVVLLHAVVGTVAMLYLIVLLWGLLREGAWIARLGWLLIAGSAGLGLVLIKIGALRSEWNLLYIHIGLALAGCCFLYGDWAGRRGWLAPGLGRAAVRYAACFLALAGLSAGAYYSRNSRWLNSARIQNPADAPETMNDEGDGPQGDFFPSSAQVYGRQTIPSKFFMESESCQRCHADIYKQWQSSAHHFSSFNNQWYRKSVEYMQDRVGTKPSKWCGGCHDPAVLYSGLMDTPIKQIVHRPEAQAGLGCMMCHSIARVKSTMGQGDFYLEYPKLHELAASKNPFVRTMHDFLVKLNPEPHRRVFLKPFMRDQTPEFCSSCHKVHLDVPVNHYRWIRGFNEYDNWQASGVSGQGARSFFYPAKPAGCADCHMPLTHSSDMGNISGFVHSHRFPAANTAVPTANGDADQLRLTEAFLKSGILSVDIFAISPEPAE